MKRYTRSNARRSVFQTAIFRALSQAATLGSTVVLVRGLSEHDFGVYTILISFLSVISTIASLGIEQTLRRYQPEYLQSNQVHAAAWLMKMAATARFGVNAFLLVLMLVLWNQIAPFFELTPYRVEFQIFALLTILHFQASLLQVSLSSHVMQGYGVGMTAVWSFAKLVGYLVLTHYERLTLNAAIVADLIAYALMYAGLRFAYVRYCRPQPPAEKFKIDPVERKRLLRYGIYNNFNDAGTLLLTARSDNLFIAALMNPLAAGAYGFYVRLIEMSSQILPIRQFSNVIQPFFFAVPRAQAAERIPRYFTFLLNTTLLLQLPIAVYLTAYHREIVQLLFGGKFLDYSWLLPIMIWWATVNRIAEPVTMVAQYEEKAKIILLSKVFGIYNALALLALVPFLGVYGAALATGTAQTMKNVFIWWHVRDQARWINWRAVLVAAVAICGTAIAACYGLKVAFGLPPLMHLVAGVFICVIAGLTYVRTPAISASDRQLVGSIMHGREQRLLRWVGLVRRHGTVSQ